MKCAAIIAAGGSGSRLHPDVPKQLLPLGGTPLFVWPVRVFQKVQRVHEIVVAVPKAKTEQFQRVAEGISKLRWVAGGARRQDSVRSALEEVSPEVEIVLVHDAARPFITAPLVDLLIDTAMEHQAAIPVTPLAETLKEVFHGRVVRTVDRNHIFCAQTPQAFRREALLRIFHSFSPEQMWTDEASMFEAAGLPVAAVAGDSRNIKITYPEDFQYAEYLLSTSMRRHDDIG